MHHRADKWIAARHTTDFFGFRLFVRRWIRVLHGHDGPLLLRSFCNHWRGDNRLRLLGLAEGILATSNHNRLQCWHHLRWVLLWLRRDRNMANWGCALPRDNR